MVRHRRKKADIIDLITSCSGRDLRNTMWQEDERPDAFLSIGSGGNLKFKDHSGQEGPSSWEPQGCGIRVSGEPGFGFSVIGIFWTLKDLNPSYQL